MSDFPVIRSYLSSEGLECRVEVPANCAFFEGHFPGRPVLPAIAQLVLITQVYRQAVARAAFICKIEFLRLYGPIGSGDILSVAITRSGEDGRSRFTIRRGGRLASRGIVTWSAGAF